MKYSLRYMILAILIMPITSTMWSAENDFITIWNQTKKPVYLALLKTKNGSKNKEALLEKNGSFIAKFPSLAQNRTISPLEYDHFIGLENFPRKAQYLVSTAYDRTVWASYDKEALLAALSKGRITDTKVLAGEVGSATEILIRERSKKLDISKKAGEDTAKPSQAYQDTKEYFVKK